MFLVIIPSVHSGFQTEDTGNNITDMDISVSIHMLNDSIIMYRAVSFVIQLCCRRILFGRIISKGQRNAA